MERQTIINKAMENYNVGYVAIVYDDSAPVSQWNPYVYKRSTGEPYKTLKGLKRKIDYGDRNDIVGIFKVGMGVLEEVTDEKN